MMRFAAAAAAVLVLALVGYLTMSDGGRGGTRRAGVRDDPAARGAATEQRPAQDVGTGDVAANQGALAITLAIVDPDDRPADGAEVEIDRGIDALRATADGEGMLRVRGLAPGLYDLRARRGRLAGSLHFELRRTTDLGTLKLAAAVSISGHVFGPRGEPLAGARVEACRADDRGAGMDMMRAIRSMSEPEEVVARAATADDGAYELLVPPGTYALRAGAQGFALEGEAARRYAVDTEGVDFWLIPGAILAGRVVDAKQTPVAAARVLVIDPMSLFGRRMPKAETVTAADGAFSMVVSPAQQSALVVSAAGYASHMQPSLQLPQTDLVIVLDEGVTLKLRAVDAERPEVPAAHVNVIAIYKGGFAAGRTDDLGLLSIENLPTRDTGMMGGEERLFLWGGGFIAQEVEISGKEPAQGVLDLGEVKVAPGGVVRGRVLDKTTGEPIEGARVRSIGGLDPQLEIFGSAPATSASDGSFRLTGVPLDAHSLLAIHPDYASSVNPMEMIGIGAAGGPPLFPEGSRDVERNVELVPAQTITGIVLAPDGSPVAGANVDAVGDERVFVEMLGLGPVAATSDGRGAFVLKGVPPGAEVTVAATHRDYGPSESAKALAGEPLTLRLSEPRSIKGTVVDDRGSPVPGVRVVAGRAPPPRAPSESVATRPSITDAEGRYLVRNAPTGELTVTFDHPDFALTTVQTASEDLGRTVLSRGGTIAGQVVDGDGKPVEGVPVYGWREQGDDGRRNANVVTDAQGRFSMKGLAEGEYNLRTWNQRYYAKQVKARTGTTDARIVLRAAAKLTGRVTGRGQPVANASVNARSGNDFVGWARTGQDGTFVMAPLPPDEAFDVQITHDAFRSLAAKGVRASDATQEFVLDPGNEVAGRVVDAKGAGVANAQVHARAGDGNVKSVQTDSTGAFTAGGLDAGRVSVQLDESGQGFIPTEWVEVAPGARDVLLVATPGESIAGIVRDREGAPAQQVSLQAVDAAGNMVASTWVWQEDGVFELRGLRPGTYTVRAQRYGEAPGAAHDVPGVATGTKNLDVRVD